MEERKRVGGLLRSKDPGEIISCCKRRDDGAYQNERREKGLLNTKATSIREYEEEGEEPPTYGLCTLTIP